MTTRRAFIYPVLCMAILLAGCGGRTVHRSTTKIDYKDGISAQLQKNTFEVKPSLVQQVVYTRGESSLSFTAMVEVSDDSVVIAGLSPLGKRQFMLTLTEKEFSWKEEPLFELPFPAEYMARDFLLVFADASALKAQNSGIEVVDAGKWRDIRDREQLVIQIEYEKRGFSTGTIRLAHLVQGYTLEIDTVQVDFPAEVITPEEE
jgi:hypothetical protein